MRSSEQAPRAAEETREHIETEEDLRRTRCRLTRVGLTDIAVEGCGKDFYGVEGVDANTASMPRNSCSLQVEAGTYAHLSECAAHVLPDGSSLIRLRGGGANPKLHHSDFARGFIARLVTPPPLNQGQRFDVALGCSGDAMTFNFRPGHSAHLAEVRIDTASPEGLARLQRETGNDWRSVGVLSIAKWTDEEVMGEVRGIDIGPLNGAIPIHMAFRLDWQQGGDLKHLLDCDPYRGWEKVLSEPRPAPGATPQKD